MQDIQRLQKRRDELTEELGEPITLDGLAANWWIFQRRHGHRHSTDDLLTGWYALQQASPARRVLDLGSGIGTVGLLVLSGMREASLTAVEVQSVSFRLLLENLWANDVQDRVRAIHGDLREVVRGSELGEFDIVTGSPPYFDVKRGIVPADGQKAAARFELHGDVNDYCHAARHALTANGRFVFCFPTAQLTRARDAVARSGLRLVQVRNVIPKAGTPALFSLFSCQHPGADNVETVEEAPLCVREANGEHTPQMTAVRGFFGMVQLRRLAGAQAGKRGQWAAGRLAPLKIWERRST